MIKRFFSVILIIIFLFLLPLTLHADVVGGNEFFYAFQEDAERIGETAFGKTFIINSPFGYVIPAEKPGSKMVIAWESGFKYDELFFQNGYSIQINAVYLSNGKYWGVMPAKHWARRSSYWFLMDNLLVVYDREDFETENEDRIYAYTGDFDAVLSAEKLVVWQWPGSDREKKIIEDKEMIGKSDDILFAYKDSGGREWGKSNDAQGWICLSDPENKTNIPMFYPAPEPVKWSHDGSPDWTKAAIEWLPAEPVYSLLIIVVSFVVIVAITVVLTIGLKHRAKVKKLNKISE